MRTEIAKTTSHQYLRIIVSFREKSASKVVEIYTKRGGLKARKEKVYKALTVVNAGNKKGASPCRRAPF